MTTTPSFMADRFAKLLSNIAFEIPFDPEWKNGTGYFDHAVDCYVPEGRVVKSICPDTERRIVLVGTVLGTVVVFERYTPKPEAKQAFILTWHAPNALKGFIGEPALTSDGLEGIVCTYYPQDNISKHVDKLIDAGIKARARLAEKAAEMVAAQVEPEVVTSETRVLTGFEAVVAAVKSVNGLVLDDHRGNGGKLQLCGVATLDKGDSSIPVALIHDDYFSLNEVYLDDQGVAHISTRAVGGVIHTPKRLSVTLADGIAKYNEESRTAKWTCGTVENVTTF